MDQETILIPAGLLKKKSSPLPRKLKTQANNKGPKATRSLDSAHEVMGGFLRKAGRLWCVTLSQLEADENESFQRRGGERTEKEKNSHDPQIPPLAVAFLAC